MFGLHLLLFFSSRTDDEAKNFLLYIFQTVNWILFPRSHHSSEKRPSTNLFQQIKLSAVSLAAKLGAFTRNFFPPQLSAFFVCFIISTLSKPELARA